MKNKRFLALAIAAHMALGSVILVQSGCQTTQPEKPSTPPPPPPEVSLAQGAPRPVNPAFNAGTAQGVRQPPTRPQAVTSAQAPGASDEPGAILEPLGNMGDPSAQQAAPAQTYKVERGDSLSAIARRFGVSVAEIKTANNLSTDTIKVGQELLIPGAGVAAASFVVEGETSEYVVATGDSLSVIARRFGVSVAAIKAANNLSGDTIRIGQKLVIPAAGQVVPSAAPAPAPKAPAPAISGQTYTVQEGETLGGIANRAGVKVQDLMAVNNITDPRKLRVGQVLQIPVGGRVPAAALAPSAPAVAPRPAVVEEAPAPIRVEPAATVPASGGAEDLEMLDDEPATPTVPVQGDDSGSELP